MYRRAPGRSHERLEWVIPDHERSRSAVRLTALLADGGARPTRIRENA